MDCVPFDALFPRPQSGAWTLVPKVRGVTLGAKKLTAVSLASVVRCPQGLYALRDEHGKFVSASGETCVLSDDSALPVRVWMLEHGHTSHTSIVLEAPCGPFDTADRGTFLTYRGGEMRYVGAEFEYDALVAAGATDGSTSLSRS